ncbi:MAG TPA: serine hydrolase domain-containing protein [Caulobacteraceae bacterium]|jgi:CubicO group peptidase (beta-lactamase class C family)
MRRRTFTLAGLSLSLAGAAGAQPSAGGVANDDPIAPILKETQAPALAGAVVTKDMIPWLAAEGVRQGPGSAAVSTNDQWHLGSNTKAMTAALYARLVEQGKAHWGATVPELFPGVKIDPAWQSTTIEQLMSHAAGVSDKPVIDSAWLTSAQSDPRPLPEQRRAFAGRVFHAPPPGKPGQFEYANADFIIAGAAIEQITGGSWEDAIRSELFDPLGMASAGFGAPKGDEPWGHGADGAPIDPSGLSDNPPALGPAGTVHVSLPDYAKFARLFFTDGGGFLTPASIAKLTTPLVSIGTPNNGYALGWVVSTNRPWAKGPILWHEGSNTLWHAAIVVSPVSGFAVLAASNDEARGGKAVQALFVKLVHEYSANQTPPPAAAAAPQSPAGSPPH